MIGQCKGSKSLEAGTGNGTGGFFFLLFWTRFENLVAKRRKSN